MQGHEEGSNLRPWWSARRRPVSLLKCGTSALPWASRARWARSGSGARVSLGFVPTHSVFKTVRPAGRPTRSERPRAAPATPRVGSDAGGRRATSWGSPQPGQRRLQRAPGQRVATACQARRKRADAVGVLFASILLAASDWTEQGKVDGVLLGECLRSSGEACAEGLARAQLRVGPHELLCRPRVGRGVA